MQRETYDLLSWLGDIGGLIDALRYAITFLMAPYTAFSAKSKLLRSLFRMKSHVEDDAAPSYDKHYHRKN